MAIHELSSDEIRSVPTTTFAEAHVLERQHLQRLLRSSIEMVAPGTMVLAEEFGDWEGSSRRIDLLALDTEGNLVVVELKRDQDGAHMELQALRYAAMVSTMTFAKAVGAHQRYLTRIGREDVDARSAILQHLGWAEPHEDDFAQDVRIVLVSANFSIEITSTVMWLNERGLDIRCVRVQPYKLDNRILLDIQPIIPLPEAATYQVQLKDKATESRASKTSGKGTDRTQYDLRIGETRHAAQPKRRMIFLVVQFALARGVKPADLPLLARRWLVVDGLAYTREEFVDLVRTKLPDRSFEELRWFLEDDELFRDATSTFVLSNQWTGADVLSTIDVITERYPQLGISYEPTSSIG
jgi:hypothetical protein